MSGGRIVAIGSVSRSGRSTRSSGSDGDIITAGLINTHHHFYHGWMTRGWAFDCTLFGWLTALYPVWARITPEDVESRLGRGRGDASPDRHARPPPTMHYVVPGGDDSVFDAIASAARTIGIRLTIARRLHGPGPEQKGACPGLGGRELDAILASTGIGPSAAANGDRIVVTVAPCSPFSRHHGADDGLRRSWLTAPRGSAAPIWPDLDEEQSCLQRFGKRPLAVLDGDGLDRPDVWVAHGIHFDDAEVARAWLGETRTGIAHCPSQRFAGSGRASRGLSDLTAAGGPVGLGVDGVAAQ